MREKSWAKGWETRLDGAWGISGTEVEDFHQGGTKNGINERQ